MTDKGFGAYGCPITHCKYNYDGECIPNENFTDDQCHYLKNKEVEK